MLPQPGLQVFAVNDPEHEHETIGIEQVVHDWEPRNRGLIGGGEPKPATRPSGRVTTRLIRPASDEHFIALKGGAIARSKNPMKQYP